MAVWSQGRTVASRLSYLGEWAESPQARSLSLSLQIPPGLTLDDLASIQPRHWTDLAARTGVPDLPAAMREMAEAVPRAIAEVEAELPTDFPPRVFEAITQGLARQAKAFLKPAGAAPPTS